MDWARFSRVLEAERLEGLEERRVLVVGGKLESSALSPDEWAEIAEMDEEFRTWQAHRAG